MRVEVCLEKKIDLCKETLEFIIQNLQESDRLGIISYASIVTERLGLMKMTAQNKNLAQDSIRNIQAGGGTSLYQGLERGIEHIRDRVPEEKNEVASVLLLTDGQTGSMPRDLAGMLEGLKHPWVAIPGLDEPNDQMPPIQQSPAPVQQKTLPPPPSSGFFSSFKKKVATPTNRTTNSRLQTRNTPDPKDPHVGKRPSPEEQEIPCSINTFGYGADHDPLLLKGLADASNGSYYFVAKNEDIPEAFADCLGGLVSVAAQNISVKFRAENGATILKIFTKFKLNEISPGKEIEVIVGDIQSEEQKDILVAVSLTPLQVENPESVYVSVETTCFNVLTCNLETLKTEGKISRQNSNSKTRNFDVDKNYNRVLAADAMTRAAEFGRQDKYDDAKTLLADAMSKIRSSPSASDSFCSNLMTELENCSKGLRDRATFLGGGQQAMLNNCQSHWNQRSNNASSPSQMGYQNSAKKKMQSVFKKSS
eukprot:TRINITY_DN1866_c0_g1_i2.p1 TRINITY_DN1866_c0_g1~~TRINITY_DN1866_c0_g1_i2.p1  ORF type:complete len:479 (+),score=170.11 TRINITY_DN1866_c0_g1_i2:182-1618(+)